jgi:tRNA pseudouridine55 synthase
VLFGVLNIYKPTGMTSHDVISILRKKTGVRQIGHTGTLDPFAQGVLPVCIGKATRLIEYMADDKEYLATVQFGSSTTTFDIEGEIVFKSDKKISEKEIAEHLKFFEGEIEQIPPIYSAIKVNGKKLYEYARKGENVEVKPRKVFIENIELKSFNSELQQAEILLKCSKGTYIRSIANDLGNSLSTGAHLIKLIRTQAGNFRVENSTELENINFQKDIINPLKMINLPIIQVEEKDLENIKNGIHLNKNTNFTQPIILVYNNEEICAVGQNENGKIKLKKVFL